MQNLRNSGIANRMQMTHILANYVIRANQQSGSCAVESPQSRDNPTTMLYYVHQTLFFPRPHTKEGKESGYARLKVMLNVWSLYWRN